MAKHRRRYDLTVYYTINGSRYPVYDGCFYSITNLLKFCADFNTDDFEVLFDVFDSERGQYNVNDLVEVFTCLSI